MRRGSPREGRGRSWDGSGGAACCCNDEGGAAAHGLLGGAPTQRASSPCTPYSSRATMSQGARALSHMPLVTQRRYTKRGTHTKRHAVGGSREGASAAHTRDSRAANRTTSRQCSVHRTSHGHAAHHHRHRAPGCVQSASERERRQTVCWVSVPANAEKKSCNDKDQIGSSPRVEAARRPRMSRECVSSDQTSRHLAPY